MQLYAQWRRWFQEPRKQERYHRGRARPAARRSSPCPPATAPPDLRTFRPSDLQTFSPSTRASAPQVVKCLDAGVARRVAQLLLDPQQAVVLLDAVHARGGAGLDLPGVGGHGEVGHGRVAGLA